MLEQTRKYAIEKHLAVGQMRDELPYHVGHLEPAYQVGLRFIHLIPKEHREFVLCGIWVHDITEDALQTYNDVKKATNTIIAEYAYALENEKGKTRAERANDKYYQGIRELQFATFIKLCDRIANIEYGIEHGSKSGMYKKEQAHFKSKLYVKGEYEDMWEHIEKILA